MSREYLADPSTGAIADRPLWQPCSDCGESFSITPDERDWYHMRDLTLPKRCKRCRKLRRLSRITSADVRKGF